MVLQGIIIIMNNSFFKNSSNLSYIILIISFLTFFYNLANIQKTIFDEFHYVPAAKQWIELAPTSNIEHPPLGKYFIAIGIKLFGDNPVGWRAATASSGALTIVFIFLISNLIFKDQILSVTISLFSLFNFWIYVQSRIAMLDIFMVMCFLAGIYYFLKFYFDKNDPFPKVTFYLSAIFWGLAVAIKWSAVFIYLPFYIVVFFSTVNLKDYKSILKLLSFGLLSVCIYFCTFLPFLFVQNENHFSLYSIIFELPFLMLKLQESVPTGHTYGSAWYTWPFMIRPIWYDFIQASDPSYFQGVVLLGNPWQMLLGVLSVFILLVRWTKNKILTNFTLVLFLSSWLVWAIMPRKLFFFYYFFPSAIFYSFLIPMTLQEFLDVKTVKKVMIIFTLISILFFLFFYPILSGAMTVHTDRDKWFWLQGWI